VKNIGFTGTRYGMTPHQRMRVLLEVEREADDSMGIMGHHGDCIGADAQFHEIIRMFPFGHVVGHIPTNDEHRARCVFDEERPPLPYMKRNAAIVAAANVMIAAPFEMTEQERGGTWRTIKLARLARKPISIVLPDGSLLEDPLSTKAVKP